MHTPPKRAEPRPLRLHIGPVSADASGMTTNTPRVTRPQVANVLTTGTAVVSLDLTSGRTRLDPMPAESTWDDPTVLVLITSDDVRHAAAQVAGAPDFLGAVTRMLNRELADLAVRGEIPTAEEVESVLDELAHFEAEQDEATVIAFPGGAG